MQAIDWRPLVAELARLEQECRAKSDEKQLIEQQLTNMTHEVEKLLVVRAHLKEYLRAMWRAEGNPPELDAALKAVENGDDIPF